MVEAHLHDPLGIGRNVLGGRTIGVVIPARNEEKFIRRVLETLPEFVDNVVVVDDGSTDATRSIVEETTTEYQLSILSKEGIGVGAAIDAGHQFLLQICPLPFISVVVAGDGQMNPDNMSEIISPILQGEAEYVKGNRFKHHKGLQTMPKHRQIASRILGTFTGFAAGQPIQDPQCGYTATDSKVLEKWDWNKSWKGYGYPNYWIVRLSTMGFRIKQVPVESVYGLETSGIKRFDFFLKVGTMLAIQHHKRNFRWLFSSRVTPQTLFAFISYFIGWIALLPNVSTDLERELVSRGIHPLYLVLGAWAVAHVFDRAATRTVQELRRNAST